MAKNTTASEVRTLVERFCNKSRTFHMQQLNNYVARYANTTFAPDSPGRTLRRLRQEGVVNYVAINPSKSLFQVL